MKTFQFKYFTLFQEHAALKVGTDSLVLAALIDAVQPQRVLDVGSGTGVLSFLMAQRFPLASITGVELDEAAIEDALTTLKDPFFKSKQLRFECADFTKFQPQQTYDLIVSNPPYFIASTKNSDSKSSQARHTDSLHPNALFENIVNCLSDEGAAWLIYPVEFENEFEMAASASGLFPTRSITIYGKPNKAIRKVSCFKALSSTKTEAQFVIRNEDGSYSEQYKRATIEFHDRKL